MIGDTALLLESRRLRRLGFALVRFEGHLENSVTQGVSVQSLDCNHGFIIVGHSNKSKSLALVGLEIADNLNALNGAEWAKELP